MSIYNKINAGFSLGTGDPITAGIEDVIYIFNEDDITLTYDISNPLIVTGLTAVSGAKIYKFEGTNNSFNTMSKMAKTQVGPRYTEEGQGTDDYSENTPILESGLLGPVRLMHETVVSQP